ncbi:unnamed protein product [Ilex paraguariensis]|uniref:CNNM transmembrane domain-containing protein n=1 Tax=Ilex paraguariensis TaxID=185542 RepID=A0ABC8U5J3_9AQUA
MPPSLGAKHEQCVRKTLVFLHFSLNPMGTSVDNVQLLDLLLGKGHSALLRRAELKTLVDMHGNEAGKGGELTHDETTIISGALDLTQKTARDAMTLISEVFSLDLNFKLNDDMMSIILNKGHSRVPVYSGSPTNIIGLILVSVKNLIKCRPEDETPIRNLTIRRIPRVHDGLPLYAILNEFQNGHSHMAVVVKSKNDCNDTSEKAKPKHDMLKMNTNSNLTEKKAAEKGVDYQYGQHKQLNISRYASSVASSDMETQSPAVHGKITNEVLESFSDLEEEIVGIITMEDVLEQLLQEPILDETDEYVDVHNKIRINMLPSIRSASGSPGAASASHMNWRSPVASPFSSKHQTPLSSYQHTPVLRSPISPYIQSPFVRPILSSSPGKSVPNPAAAGTATGPVRGSPSSHRVRLKFSI